MDLTTHVLMANMMYKEVTAKIGIRLDYWHYIYGNIKPDINPQDIEWPHFIKDSLKELVNYCEYMIMTPMSLKELSVALGTVSHFICDYHCLYHREDYKQKSMLEHIFYEKCLSFNFIKKCLAQKVKVTHKEMSYRSINDTINSSYVLYSKEEHSLSQDIQYAIDTTICVISRILESSRIQKREHSDMEMVYHLLKVEGSGL